MQSYFTLQTILNLIWSYVRFVFIWPPMFILKYFLEWKYQILNQYDQQTCKNL